MKQLCEIDVFFKHALKQLGIGIIIPKGNLEIINQEATLKANMVKPAYAM